MLNPPGHAPGALDLVVVEPGTGGIGPGWIRWATVGVPAAAFPSWQRPVLAPFGGTVARAHDGEPDRGTCRLPVDLVRSFVVAPLRHGTDVARMAGNHLVLDTGRGWLLLAHLSRGTVRVGEGEHVTRGQTLGLVGSSGNAVAPHLHLQLMDTADPTEGTVVPFVVGHYRYRDRGSWVDRHGEPLRPGHVRGPAA